MFETIAFLLHGTKYFGREGYARAAKGFDNSIMKRTLDGKLCLVTGANQGIGLATSIELAKHGAKVYMVCRNPERGEAAVAQVKSQSGSSDVFLKVCDISSLASVVAFADGVAAAGEAVYCLVNNAGVLINEREKSVDGFDMNTATNTLGTYVLTALLAPALARCPGSRIITVTSGGMYTQHLDSKDLNNKNMHKYDGSVAYALDKRRQVAMTERLAELLGKSGVGVYAMHPGWTETDGVKKSIPGFYKFYKDKFRDIGMGIDTIVWLALQDQDKLKPGALYLDRTEAEKHLCMAGTHYTKKDVDQLFAAMNKMVSGVVPEERLKL
uniref:Dehydrogenase/reductase SDR family member 12 n=1 Tax=Chlamydomonas euryale TaxID=1486919 RepID=A0A7R9V154_9CHLO|mmetsp:Transcript_13835/g.40100  ORF Transcript_13835/g.40100 Transcript_13835/m.40100 type:complete len:326 (+) Transcript_13835:90-1067(+)